MPRTAKEPPSGHALAVLQNTRGVKAIEKRAEKVDAVLHACLRSYQDYIESHPGKMLDNLTHHLVSTSSVTEAAIRKRMSEKYGSDLRAVESAVTNSLRRSAGTNYQSLVSYALAKYLLNENSSWYVVFPVPPSFGHSLGIKFGIPVDGHMPLQAPRETSTAVEQSAESSIANDLEILPDGEARLEEQQEDDSEVVVKPDLDILLRNASWKSDSGSGNLEPILVLSVKTSLADRAGSAARWKTYFDLVTQPCAHECESDCAYRRLGITLNESIPYSISHGIVTANIYKINSDQAFAVRGELNSNQAKANTFMFDLRYTTRTDSPSVAAPGWVSLAEIAAWFRDIAKLHNMQP